MLNDLLDKTKGFKYQITVKLLSKKDRGTEIEFSPVFFNSTTNTVINHKFDLDKSFQEILCRIDNRINESSGWIVESVMSQNMNISTYRPLIVMCCITLPLELSAEKGLINFKNNDQKWFFWCHVRHINPVKINP